MNLVLDDLPNLPVFRFDAVVLEYEAVPVVPGTMAEWQAVIIDQMNAPTAASITAKAASAATSSLTPSDAK